MLLLTSDRGWTAIARSSDDRGCYGLPSPPPFAALIQSVETAPPGDAARLVDNFNGLPFSVRLERTAPDDLGEVPESMASLADAYRRALLHHAVLIDGGPSRLNGLFGDRARSFWFLVPIRIAMQHRHGGVLVLTSKPADVLRAYLAQRSLIRLVG